MSIAPNLALAGISATSFVQERRFAGEIPWSHPAFQIWSAAGESVLAAIDNGLPLHRALQKPANKQINAVHFVLQSALPSNQPYESYIFETGTVPTRENLHDFFNGLCWMRFPLTKRRLNALQASEISRAGGVQGHRGPLRDALTLFDENGALLLAPQPLWDALLVRDWQQLFVRLRPLWAEAQLVVFGHALLEKLVCPRKSITAHVYIAQAAMHSIADLDSWLAGELQACKLATKPFAPLPVMGVPGWCPENNHPAFYSDERVFRKPCKNPVLGPDNRP